MQTQRQAQVQRSPTERFALALRDYVDERLCGTNGEAEKALVRLEDAFNDAVDARVLKRESEVSRVEEW